MKLAQKVVNTAICSLALVMGLPTVGYCALKGNNAKKAEQKVEQEKEQLKEKFHQGVDVSREKVHESIDQVADYFDPDKLKDGVDQLAAYFDKDKIKGFIDLAAEHLSKDRIKDFIDFVAENFDREKLKGEIDKVFAKIDKEQLKQSFDQTVDQGAALLTDAIDTLEHEIRHVGSNQKAIREMVGKYNWRNWLNNQASYGPATLSGLKLGEERKFVTLARPGQKIEGEVVCSFDRSQCASLSLYRVVLGIKNREGQTTIFNHFGLRAGKETDHFTLTAPREKGVYQVAFRVVEAAREETALKTWSQLDEQSDSEPAVIGLIIVV